MNNLEKVIGTAKTHIDAKRERGATLTPAELEVEAVLAWQDPKVQYRFSSFTGFETARMAQRSEAMISEYQKREGCSYKEALLAVSERHPALVR